jgi:hypothetical protein
MRPDKQRCVAVRMRPELDASSYPFSQRCVAARMRPGTGCVQSTAMRRCPDASGTGNWMRPVSQRCVAARMRPELDASSYLLSQRRVAARMRPELDASSYLLLPAMRRCPDASGTGCVQINSDASLPGCVRNWMRPVNGDASLPGCVRNRKMDASSSQRCVAARMRP